MCINIYRVYILIYVYIFHDLLEVINIEITLTSIISL